LILAVIGPESSTVRCAAGIGGLEVVGNTQSRDLNVRETKVGDDGPHNDGSSDSKVVNGVADILVAAESRSLEASEEKDSSGSSETQNDAQQGSLVLAVVVAELLVVLVESVGGIQVSEETTWSKWTADSVQDENRDNQQGKDVICESCRESDVSGKVKEGGEGSVGEGPDRHPSIKGKEGNVKTLGHIIDNSTHDKDGSSRSNNDGGHAAENRHEDTHPAGSKDGLDRSNLVLSVSAVDGTESKSRGDHSDEHQKGHRDGFLVEVGELFYPVGSDGGSEFLDNTTTPWLAGLCSTILIEGKREKNWK
jgi:hypothetical protein